MLNIIKDPETKRSTGRAIVSFHMHNQAVAAQQAMNNAKVLGGEIVVYFKKSLEEKLKSKCNLIIKNLHPDISSK